MNIFTLINIHYYSTTLLNFKIIGLTIVKRKDKKKLFMVKQQRRN